MKQPATKLAAASLALSASSLAAYFIVLTRAELFLAATGLAFAASIVSALVAVAAWRQTDSGAANRFWVVTGLVVAFGYLIVMCILASNIGVSLWRRA